MSATRLIPLLCVLLVGCGVSLPLGSSSLISCNANAICPDGMTCVGSRCVAPELVDLDGAAQVVPEDRAIVRAGEIELGWASVSGASKYTLVVARDPSFTQTVADTPRDVDGTTTTLELADGTYYWRVISDVTLPGTWTTRIFGVVSEAIHVRCAALDDCVPNDTTIELGTLDLPFRAVSRAVIAAAARGVQDIRVAKRAGDAAYDDVFTLTSGMRVLGGYSDDFATRDGRTVIENADTVVSAFNISGVALLDSLVLRAKADAQSTVLRMLVVGGGFTAQDVRFESPLLQSPLVVIEARADDIGPTFSQCEFATSIDSTIRGAATAPIISAFDRATFTLDKSRVAASSSVDSPTLVGIQLASSTATIRDSTITLDAHDDAIGLLAHGPGDYTYEQTLALANVDVSVTAANNATAVVVDNDEVVAITRSTLEASAGALGVGITVSGVHLFKVTSSVVKGLLAPNTHALVATDMEGVMQNNTFVSTNGLNCMEFYGESYPAIVNNLFLCHWSFEPVIALDDTAQPGGVLNNALVQVPGSDGMMDFFPVVGTRRFGDSVFYNVIYQDFSLAMLDGDYRPLATSPLVGAGRYPVDYCGPAVVRPPTPEDLAIIERQGFPSCGGVVVDRDNRPRPMLPTIGAYEP